MCLKNYYKSVVSFSKLVLVVAPSGAGKSSLVRYLLEHFPELSFSVSATTRPPRAEEREGRDYYFIPQSVFEQKINNKEFLEWEMVYTDLYYGTLKVELSRIWKEKKVPLLEIDVQGAIKLMNNAAEMGNNICSVFLMPPSIEELRRRLIHRNTESIEVIEDRIKKASYELTLAKGAFFKNIIVNDDIHTCCAEVGRIVTHYLAS